MAKKPITMRLDEDLVKEAKKVLGVKETTEMVESVLKNVVSNHKALKIMNQTAGKSSWKGVKVDE